MKLKVLHWRIQASMDSGLGFGQRIYPELIGWLLRYKQVSVGSIRIIAMTQALLGVLLIFSKFHSRTKEVIFFCLRGGMKESGIGRENGIEAFEACKSPYFIQQQQQKNPKIS